MKNKRILALLLAILLIISSLPSLFVGAATGTVTKNTGVRHTICTALSSQALAYYSTNNALFDNISTLQGGTDNCLTTVDSPLFDELHDLMDETMTTTVSYNSLTTHWQKTDANNGSSEACLFYSDFVSSGYNREHVWPKSHASFKEKNGGADPHHLRPTNSTINSTRNNYLFANVRETVSGYKTKENGGKTVLYYGSNKVEVNDNIKGDVARILLYVYCRWEEPNLFMNTPNPVIGPSDDKNTGEKVIESLDLLLEWCEIDPVDTWEMSRNDQCENLVGNRNVFIDYPEYAWLLFGEEVPNDMTTPSGEAKGGDLGGNTGGGTTPTCTHTNVKYVLLNDDNHQVICLSCSKTIRTEAHTLTNNKCNPCGYEKADEPTPPPTSSSSVTFEFGANSSATHVDGNDLGSSKTYSQDGYDLKLTSMSKVFGPSYDAKGNSCIKLGSSSTIGKFTFTVPNNVTSVVIKVAQYKANTTKISINNGSAQTISTASNNGAYTDITIDTTKTKTITLSTVSGGVRAMVNSITYNLAVEHTHSFTEQSKTDPTYFKDGVLVKKCSCGETTTTTLPKDTSTPFIYDEVEFNPANDSLTIVWSYTDAFLGDYIATEAAQPTLKFVYTTAGRTYETGSFDMYDGENTITVSGFNSQRISSEFTFCFELSWKGDIDSSYTTAAQAIPTVSKHTVIPQEIIFTQNDVFDHLLNQIEQTEQEVCEAIVDGNNDFSYSTLKVDIINSTVTLRFNASDALINKLAQNGKENREVTLYINLNGNLYTVPVAKLHETTIVTISNLSFTQLGGNISIKLGFEYANSALNFETEDLTFNCQNAINNTTTDLALAFKNYIQNVK